MLGRAGSRSLALAFACSLGLLSCVDDPGEETTPFTATAASVTSVTGGSTTTTTTGSAASIGTTETPTTSAVTGSDSGSTTQVAPTCGDGIVQDDEECDEGPENDDAAPCTTSCVRNVCGDGLVHDGTEECDDADANGDTAPCTSGCRLNVCGDGLILEGVEACDDGYANDDGSACTSTCSVNICGDGLVHEGVEECDDGGQFVDGGDGCSATCTREQVVFATLDAFTGDLGGALGADERCLEAGTDSIALPWPELNNTTFRAWIAAPDCPLAKRLPQETRPYVRVDGELIAENWSALVGGGLAPGKMQMNEYGLVIEEIWGFRVWSAIAGDGVMLDDAAAKTCNFWTLAGDSFFGALGMANAGGSAWTRALAGEGDLVQGCHEEARLYCVQISCDEHPEFCEPGYCAP